MRGMIGELEWRMEKLEGEKNAGLEGDGESAMMEKRLREMERKMEIREREERRKNFLIKGLEIKERKRREAVEEMLKMLGVEVEIKELRRIGGDEIKEMVLMGTGSEEQKKEVLRRKRDLRGRKEKIGRRGRGG